MTFSIVAWDRHANSGPEWGVAVASKFLAVGSVVPAARAGAGAIATQSFANLTYTRVGIERLAGGEPAPVVLKSLLAEDPEREKRQVGIVDGEGEAVSFTGSECFDWAGHRVGDGYCCQGNILTDANVVESMERAFETTSGDLATRMLAALSAGDEAGGDRRGRQSAALLVVRAGGGYGGETDVAIDLRVDDHPAPIPELSRVLELHRLIYPHPDDLSFLPVTEELALELRSLLRSVGYPVAEAGGYDASLKKSLFEFVGTENLEERWTDREGIEEGILSALRHKARD